MVAERPVSDTALPGSRLNHLHVWLELPPSPGRPSVVGVRVSGGSCLSLLRERACDLLGAVSLDAYLCVDGKYASSEDVRIDSVARAGSRVAVRPRLRGGVNGDDPGRGQPSRLPLPLPPNAGTSFPRRRLRRPAG